MIRFATRSHQHFFGYLPAIIVGLCLLGLSIFADRLNSSRLQQAMRDSVLERISVIRARLEGNINSNAALVRGLVSVISTEPDMSTARFIELTTPLLEGRSQLRNIAAAPDLVISYMNPLAGNRAAIGLDYRTHPVQYQAVKRARDLGELIIAGPVDLVQGGQGFIARIPVFVAEKLMNEQRFWGVVSAVIDVDELYLASGLYEVGRDMDVAIRGRDALGSKGDLVYGEAALFTDDPVLADIVLPYGLWQIGAVPKGGWAQHGQGATAFRYGLLGLNLLILLPLLLLGRFVQKKRETETRLRRLFEFSPVGIVLNDYESGRFIEVNNALLRAIGYHYDEFIGLSYLDITPEEFLPQETEQFEILKATGRYGPYEKEYIRKDGSRCAVRLNGVIIQESSGEKMIWSFVEDISEHRRAEKYLQRSQKMDAVGKLTGGIAHDFNNILAIILGNLELLKMSLDKDVEKSAQYADSIQKAAQRAADLTKKLLSFSRRRADQQDVVNLNSLVGNMENLIARSVTPEVEVTHRFAEDLWPVNINAGDFEDALLNLSINARDAMHSHGHLMIETRNVSIDENYSGLQSDVSPGDYVELSVTDDGEGIAAEYQERIFEPFYTTKEEGQGTGLGLAMVYGFVKRSGGFIDVQSSPGEGAAIRLYLPRASQEQGTVRPVAESSGTPVPEGSESILVVDDEQALLQLTQTFLESRGYRVFTAGDGEQALKVLEQQPDIRLLFSDVVMPGGINGYQLAQQATARWPNLKVLLTSGYTGNASSQYAASPFNADLLCKPYSQQELAVRLRQRLDE